MDRRESGLNVMREKSLAWNVSVNLKNIRSLRGLSLEEMAEQTGVSKSMLAQIEKGMANPSIGVLEKIANGLGIRFRKLIDPLPVETMLVHTEELVPVTEAAGEYRIWNCFSSEENRFMEMYRIEVEPGGSCVMESRGEKTREYISVIRGRIGIERKGNIRHVTTEDVYRIEADCIHTYRNEEEQKAVFMVTVQHYI